MENSRLYRNKSNTIIGGVCSGLGDYFNVDPVLFRVLFVLAVLLGGSGILIYVILWIVIPSDENEQFIHSNKNNSTMSEETMNTETNHQNNPQTQKKKDGNLWGGLILITLGAIFLIERFFPGIDFDDLWPIILIVVGVILISKSYQQSK